MLAACGGSTGSSGAGGNGQSGVAATKSLTELTDQEASQFCDWSLNVEGGAGHVTTCTDGTERHTHTKDECVGEFQTLRTLNLPCTITVNDAESCSLESQKDVCTAPTPTCDRINKCVEDATKK
jgi:hypothetical protein